MTGAVVHRLSDADRIAVLAAYLGGMKIDEIASRYGVDRAYPAKLARKHRLPRRVQNPRGPRGGLPEWAVQR